MTELSQIVDLERYPIAELGRPVARSLIAACRGQMAETGLCLLPGFVRPKALAEMVEEAKRLLPGAYQSEHWRASPHGSGGAGSGTIPRATRASLGAIAYDRIAAHSPLRALYEWDGLTDFVAEVLGRSPLYRCADPVVSCMLTVCRRNDELGWHYDPNDGVVSLMLQESDGGGAFEFAPGVRFAAPDAGAAELAVLDGRHPGVVRPNLEAGTLSLFNGHASLHRVAPVTGARERIIALFNYMAEPGYVFSAEIQRKFFGRTTRTGQ
ncbi:MAG: 2OG-Fe(II) oxygenase [Kiloniellales bacterium]|nr:2OG-Fe(II) oxygenase [Kiloniellales bacterium]